MHKFLSFLIGSLSVLLLNSTSYAQETPVKDSVTQINVNLINIFNQKTVTKYKIRNIKVVGNENFDENLLLSLSTLNIGDEVSIPGGDNFAKSIRKLMDQNYFSDVSIYLTDLVGKEIDVEINVTERPRLSKFNFLGVKKSDIDELSGKTGLTPNRVVTDNMKITAIEGIKKYYAEKGFQDVKVTIKERKDGTRKNNLLLDFVVDKGPKVRINNINFGGNKIEESKLKKSLKEVHEKMRLTLFPINDRPVIVKTSPYTFEQYMSEKGFLTFTKTRKILNPYARFSLSSAKFNIKKYEESKDNLLDYYNSLGFRDAVIEKDTVYHNAGGNLNIDLQMKEGRKYYFGNINWRGNTKYTDSILSVILNIKKGEIYNREILFNKLGKTPTAEGGDVSTLYQDDGYLFFRVDPVETAVYNDTIDFEIRIVEGPQATIKTIRIAGNEKTKDFVIRREIRTLPGDKFSRSLLIRSQREIAQLNFFDQEKIKIDPVPNPEDGTVDINYGVEEKSSDQLELSAGWGGYIGLTGTLGVTFNNFSSKNLFKKSAWDPLPMGDGQKLSVRVQSNGKAFRSTNLSFTEPWFGGIKRNTLTVSLYNTKYGQTYNLLTGMYDPNAADARYISTTGATVSFGRQLSWPDDYFSLNMGLNYTRYTLKDYAIDPYNLPNFNNGVVNNINFRIALQRTSVDQPLFPRTGSTFLLSAQLTPPYSLITPNVNSAANPFELLEYHKWRFNGEWFVPLGKPAGADHNKQFVLKFAAKYGFLGAYNSDLAVSPFERFQLGDAGLSNQFALLGYDIIAQRGYPVYESSNPKVNPDQQSSRQHFTIFNKYAVEVRYPLSLAASSTIYALGFFEAANGWYSMKEYNPFNLRRSVGIGMRFYLPMFGLLGFDYGIGIDRINGTNALKDAGRFTFMLGYEPE
ncbi:MAG: outer membrane protein assembly factor [Chitinophagia bacterium]|nr:outer membrane protein assembly factor [Chitinophagia bacterium]NCA29264.1 outer membrane protein assembly factor [Chitinophagia bacterium]NDD15476.1 outer membrane protein assembly factor [Chitinophagia bacterium]